MRFTIEGFSQEYAMTLKKEVEDRGKKKTVKIDCTDLVILRWFVDFFPNMKKMIVDGKEYAWLSHKKITEDLPILDISKRACIERMQKLVIFGILSYKLVKEGGTFSLYGFGENYINLLQSTAGGGRSTDIGDAQSNDAGGSRSNNIGGCGQPHNKDYSFKDSSFKDSDISNIKDIVDFLNLKAKTAYRASSAKTCTLIRARLKEGYTVADFKIVISNKAAEWIGTKMEKYLRPETLFGTKFEGYLNEKTSNRGGTDWSSDLDDVF